MRKNYIAHLIKKFEVHMLQSSPLIKISSSKFTHMLKTGEGIELVLSLRVPK